MLNKNEAVVINTNDLFTPFPIENLPLLPRRSKKTPVYTDVYINLESPVGKKEDALNARAEVEAVIAKNQSEDSNRTTLQQQKIDSQKPSTSIEIPYDQELFETEDVPSVVTTPKELVSAHLGISTLSFFPASQGGRKLRSLEQVKVTKREADYINAIAQSLLQEIANTESSKQLFGNFPTYSNQGQYQYLKNFRSYNVSLKGERIFSNLGIHHNVYNGQNDIFPLRKAKRRKKKDLVKNFKSFNNIGLLKNIYKKQTTQQQLDFSSKAQSESQSVQRSNSHASRYALNTLNTVNEETSSNQTSNRVFPDIIRKQSSKSTLHLSTKRNQYGYSSSKSHYNRNSNQTHSIYNDYGSQNISIDYSYCSNATSNDCNQVDQVRKAHQENLQRYFHQKKNIRHNAEQLNSYKLSRNVKQTMQPKQKSFYKDISRDQSESSLDNVRVSLSTTKFQLNLRRNKIVTKQITNIYNY